jgi:phosphate/sulfate permease
VLPCSLVIHGITVWIDGFAIGANDVANGEATP